MLVATALVDIIIGVAIGLATGLASWWIVARLVRPKLVLSTFISKLPDDSVPGAWRYRVQVINKRRLPFPRTAALDLHVTATVRILGLRPSAPTTWYRINVPVGRTGDLAYINRNAMLRLRLRDMAEEQTRLLPKKLRDEINAGTVELEGLLGLGTEAHLHVVATAAHSYTLGRSVAMRRFGSDSILGRQFGASGEPAETEARPEPDPQQA